MSDISRHKGNNSYKKGIKTYNFRIKSAMYKRSITKQDTKSLSNLFYRGRVHVLSIVFSSFLPSFTPRLSGIQTHLLSAICISIFRIQSHSRA